MSGTLFLDRQMVYGDLERLRRTIAHHIEQDASLLVAEITAARGTAALEHVTIVPSGHAGGRVWKVRVRHSMLAS